MIPIDLRIHGIGKYELLADVNVIVDHWDITVLSGFTWDGASIPKNLWDDIGCPMDYTFESLIHDALYRTNLLDRKTSDKIFHKLLIQNGVSQITAKMMYLAVRFGGEDAYTNTPSKANARKYVIILPL